MVCASAGADVLNIPPMIAKAATTAAVSVVLIKQGENTIDLKDALESSLISFIALYIAGFQGSSPYDSHLLSRWTTVAMR
jgi:hypothetical protein